MKSFQKTQLTFTQYLRAPDETPLPDSMEVRRMEIYRDLIYNNIHSLVVGVFPVLRSLMDDQQWHHLVRKFIKTHRCQTPYFLAISEEFLTFLLQQKDLQEQFPFVFELAHYEWIELALDVSEAVLPAVKPLPENLMDTVFVVSPLALILGYQYPVHKISSVFKPTTSTPTQLVVYRNRADIVRFMVVNPLTSRLLTLMQTNSVSCLGGLLSVIAQELQHPHPEQLRAEALLLVTELCELDVLFPGS
jgi:hypothetical protein